MIVDRYYYGKLTEKEKTVYREIYKGCMEHRDVISISSPAEASSFPTKSCHRIIRAVMDDNPLLYYVNQTMASIAQDSSGNLAIIPQYFFSEENVSIYHQKIQDAVNELIHRLALTEGNDLDKVRKVHDYMCENISYDHEGADKNNISRMITSHNIIGVFAHKKAQCEGIAKAAKVLLNAVDVRCIYVAGEAGEDKDSMTDHGWNIINIGGIPYHMDITFDIGAGSPGEISYDYYNVTDSQIRRDHVPAAGLPKCTEKKDNYFEQNGLVFSSVRKLEDYVTGQIDAGSLTLYFKLAGKLKAADVCPQVISLGEQKIGEKEKGAYSLKISRKINTAANTCRITFSICR